MATLASKALGKRQALQFDCAETCTVLGNETLLTILVRNLLDNAIRYSPPSACVNVCLQRSADTRSADTFMLTIEDGGPGLAPGDLQRLGERFFRMPGSVESGSGLGWSIVRRIAAAHHFHLSLDRSKQLGGLVVRVSGPAAARLQRIQS